MENTYINLQKTYVYLYYLYVMRIIADVFLIKNTKNSFINNVSKGYYDIPYNYVL